MSSRNDYISDFFDVPSVQNSVDVDFLERKIDIWEKQGCNLEILDLGPKHGTRNMYEKYKCRYDQCKEFYSRYNRAKWAKRKADAE